MVFVKIGSELIIGVADDVVITTTAIIVVVNMISCSRQMRTLPATTFLIIVVSHVRDYYLLFCQIVIEAAEKR